MAIECYHAIFKKFSARSVFAVGEIVRKPFFFAFTALATKGYFITQWINGKWHRAYSISVLHAKT